MRYATPSCFARSIRSPNGAVEYNQANDSPRTGGFHARSLAYYLLPCSSFPSRRFREPLGVRVHSWYQRQIVRTSDPLGEPNISLPRAQEYTTPGTCNITRFSRRVGRLSIGFRIREMGIPKTNSPSRCIT